MLKYFFNLEELKAVLNLTRLYLCMASTSNLTDVELRQELKNLGENPGPINANTRDIYRRKLDKLKASKVNFSCIKTFLRQ